MRVLFICQGDFAVASEKQAVGFGVELARRGCDVAFNVHGDPQTYAREKVPFSRSRVHFRHWRGPIIDRGSLRHAANVHPDIIHVFNPRAATVAVARSLQSVHDAATVVHWEDDEIGIRTGVVPRSPLRRVARLSRRWARHLYPPQGLFVTRDSLRWVRENAERCDALTPALAEWVQTELGITTHVVFPMSQRPKGSDGCLPSRPSTRVPAGLRLIGYVGTVHTESVDDFRLACEAIARVRDRSPDVALLHAGASLPRFDLASIAADAGLASGGFVGLGYVPSHAVPAVLTQCEVLLQPGRPNRFNRLRLPSKVHAYLEAGVPTVMFSVGLGELLTNEVDALLLDGFDAEELAAAILQLLENPQRAREIGARGRERALELFDPEVNAERLLACYREARDAKAAR